MALPDIAVYDPKTDGIDAKAFYLLGALDEKLQTTFIDELYLAIWKKIDESEIQPGVMLADYLSNYFERNRTVEGIVFVNGNVHSLFGVHEEPTETDLLEIANAYNAIPLVYVRKTIIEEAGSGAVTRPKLNPRKPAGTSLDETL